MRIGEVAGARSTSPSDSSRRTLRSCVANAAAGTGSGCCRATRSSTPCRMPARRRVTGTTASAGSTASRIGRGVVARIVTGSPSRHRSPSRSSHRPTSRQCCATLRGSGAACLRRFSTASSACRTAAASAGSTSSRSRHWPRSHRAPPCSAAARRPVSPRSVQACAMRSALNWSNRVVRTVGTRPSIAASRHCAAAHLSAKVGENTRCPVSGLVKCARHALPTRTIPVMPLLLLIVPSSSRPRDEVCAFARLVRVRLEPVMAN